MPFGLIVKLMTVSKMEIVTLFKYNILKANKIASLPIKVNVLI